MKHIAGKSLMLMHILLLICLVGCLPSRHRTHVKKVFLTGRSSSCTVQSDKTITIWIHGTRLFRRPTYEKLFQKSPSLKNYYQVDPEYQLTELADTLIEYHPHLFCPENFYFFGWSGKLSFQEREKAARMLYYELQNLIKTYQAQHGVKPRIRIICHSHGGNVLLKCTDFCPESCPLEIDEAILLACPVQESTQHCIHYPGFKKIISLSSKLDFIQIIDPQGLYKVPCKSKKLFSGRYFPHNNKLYQAKIQLNGRAITHHEFNRKQFLKSLGAILETCYQEIPTQERPLERNLLSIRESGDTHL